MALSYTNVTLRNSMVDVIKEALAGGKIVFKTSDGTELGTCTFANPAFDAAVGGTITARPITDETSAVAGTLAKAEFQNSSGVVLFSGTAGADPSNDVTFNKAEIEAGDIISVSSMTYSAPQ